MAKKKDICEECGGKLNEDGTCEDCGWNKEGKFEEVEKETAEGDDWNDDEDNEDEEEEI